MTRYADDFVVCCRTRKGAERVLKSIVRLLGERIGVESTSGENEDSECPRRDVYISGACSLSRDGWVTPSAKSHQEIQGTDKGNYAKKSDGSCGHAG